MLSAEYCYAVPHGSEALLSWFSEGLAALKTTREYRDIQSKWLSPYEPFERRLLTFAKYGLAMIVLLIVLLAGSFLWSRTLQRRVVVRTRELTEEITERKRAEEVRREVEGRYRLLFEQSPDGIVVIDPKTARFLEFNETAQPAAGVFAR